MTNHLASDIWILPTHINIGAKELALLFFNHWYCENGLPLNIVSNQDNLFISKFWCALHELTVSNWNSPQHIILKLMDPVKGLTRPSTNVSVTMWTIIKKDGCVLFNESTLTWWTLLILPLASWISKSALVNPHVSFPPLSQR
jgi:hypothetical protein